MSTSSEADFDLEKLFLPAWAQETPAANRYAKYTGTEGASRGFDARGRRAAPAAPRWWASGWPRPESRAAGVTVPAGRAVKASGRNVPRAGREPTGGSFGGSGRPGDRRQREEHREPAMPLPEIDRHPHAR